MTCSYFDRKTAAALKGIALILMFVHHFFTFPDWITCGVAYPQLQTFARLFRESTKICVALFAFLTGYFYVFSRGTIRYSLRKITDLLISYWIIAIPMIILAAWSGCYTLSKAGVVRELFGLDSVVMSFCWYVYFFCTIMLALPLFTKFGSRSPVMDVMVMLVLPTAVLNILCVSVSQDIAATIVQNMQQWWPCVAVGYLFGKYGLFEKWLGFFPQRGKKFGSAVRAILPALMVWAAFRGRYYIGELDFSVVTLHDIYTLKLTPDIIYAPLFLFGAANLLMLCHNSFFFRVLEKIGKHSMLMWFYHCIFFNCCRQFTQIILYFPKNPILVLLNGLILCYLAAVLTEPVLKVLVSGKNKLLDACRFGAVTEDLKK